MYSTCALSGTSAKLTDAAGTQNAQPRFNAGNASLRIFAGYSSARPVRVMLQPKNVATTTGPRTAWFRNTFHTNGGEVRGERRARGGGKLRRQRGVPEVLSGAVKHEVVRHLSRRAHEVVPRNGRVAGGRLRGGLLLRVVGGRLRESRLFRRVPRDGLREHVAHDAQAGAGVGRLEDGGALRRPGGRRGAFERHRAAPGAGEVRGAALAIAGPAGGDRPAGGERLETHREACACRCYRSRMFKPLANSCAEPKKPNFHALLASRCSPDEGFLFELPVF